MNIFVGCASRNTENEAFNCLAEEIGKFIVEGNHTYVFGGCNNGLMGKIYSVVKDTDCEVFAAGVEAYKDEIVNLIKNNPKVSRKISKTVNERKNALMDFADVIIIIPGGFGTLDELFSAIEAKRTGQNHPIFIVNVDEYYSPLIEMLEKVYSEKFASEENRDLYKICSSFDELKEELEKLS